MKGGMWGRAAAAVVVSAGAAVAFAAPASARPFPRITIPTPVGPIGTPSVNCKPPPPIRSSADNGISSWFDAKPDGVQPAVSIYDKYGVHPFAWSVYDPGCAGDIGKPIATDDTYWGDNLLGAAQAVVAFGDMTHNLVARPVWVRTLDVFETNATRTVTRHVFDVFLPLCLVLVGLLVIARAHQGQMMAALHSVGWALAVMALVGVIALNPGRIVHGVANFETSVIDTVDGALAGQNTSGGQSVSALENGSVLYPAWVSGEVGSPISATASLYGPRLLDGQMYRWSELKPNLVTPVSSRVTAAKQAEFASTAAAVQRADPGAYDQLKGQSGSRVGWGLLALGGVVATMPFILFADLLVAAALLLLMLELIFVPLIAPIAIFHRYRHMLIRGVLTVTFAALLNAALFSTAAAVNVLIVGFLLSPASGFPLPVGLLLSFLIAIVAIFALKQFRLTRLVRSDDITKAIGAVGVRFHQITHTVGQVATKAAAGSVGGPVGLAAATVVAGREQVGVEDGIPDVDPGPAGEGEVVAGPDPGLPAEDTPAALPEEAPAPQPVPAALPEELEEEVA